jgi:DNA-binding MarR family transcriptional regulator
VTDLPGLFHDLVRFQIELWNSVDARLKADHELPLTWFEPLTVVAGRPGCRVQDIAAELVITVGGTSKLVDRIEAAGLCRRTPHPDDGRSSVIELTDAGRAALDRAGATFADELRHRLGDVLADADLQHLATTLRRLRAAAPTPTPRSTP